MERKEKPTELAMAKRVSIFEAGLKKPQASTARVRVSVRLRPYMSQDDEKNEGPCVRGTGGNSLEIVNWRNTMETMQYQFDAFYGDGSSQQEVYLGSVKPVLTHLLSGQNASIFAYGPTGAGKTHTMLGSPDQPGVIPRAVRDVFQMVREQSVLPSNEEWEFTTTMSYLEIYNEKVLDLLQPKDLKDQDLPIREDKDKNILIPGLTQKLISSFTDFESHFIPASQNRTVASTKLNSRSSRSHTVLLIKVVKSLRRPPFRQLTGKLYLIDLAGSEDNRRTGNQGIRLKESGAINSSLFVLSKVVDALNQGLPRIPYRDSKLTRLLQDSLGGSAHSVMITNLAPEFKYYFDTLTALNFAAKSKQIINKPFTRETVQPTALKRPREESPTRIPAKKKMEAQNISGEVSTESAPGASVSSRSSQNEVYDGSVMERLLMLEKMMMGTPERERLALLKTVQQSRKEIQELREKQKELEAKAQEAQSLLAQQNVLQPSNSSNAEGRVKRNIRPLANKPISVAAPCSKQQAVVSPLQVSRVNPLQQNISEVETTKKTKTSKKVTEQLEGKENMEEFQCKVNSGLLKKSEEMILNLLNTGSLQDLKELQRIGDKKARLIMGYRELNGQFKQVADLANIAGFSDKQVGTFLKANLLSTIAR
ncbi:kinesin-like protein KIF22 [Polypterus senegalus]|uniref:kinesin-like protein KIF22 n=1 Tax=Polypterus senegalus TaxID=55291 RepID=UPI0019659D87|nr:kinesin-like protein KIF22 [Polypterus senegalus]